MNWIERAALAAMLGAYPDPTMSDPELVEWAASEIEDRLTEAARLWAVAYPAEAAELRDADGATSANKFLPLAENASLDAAWRR